MVSKMVSYIYELRIIYPSIFQTKVSTYLLVRQLNKTVMYAKMNNNDVLLSTA